MNSKELTKYINNALKNIYKRQLLRSISSTIPSNIKNKNNNSPVKRKRAASE